MSPLLSTVGYGSLISLVTNHALCIGQMPIPRQLCNQLFHVHFDNIIVAGDFKIPQKCQSLQSVCNMFDFTNLIPNGNYIFFAYTKPTCFYQKCSSLNNCRCYFNQHTFILFKARPGSGFYEIFCIFANMSCLCIHLVTLFNLPCKNIFVMEYIIFCRKTSFLWHAPSSQSVYFGEITRVMRDICIFSREIFSPPICS